VINWRWIDKFIVVVIDGNLWYVNCLHINFFLRYWLLSVGFNLHRIRSLCWTLWRVVVNVVLIQLLNLPINLIAPLLLLFFFLFLQLELLLKLHWTDDAGLFLLLSNTSQRILELIIDFKNLLHDIWKIWVLLILLLWYYCWVYLFFFFLFLF